MALAALIGVVAVTAWPLWKRHRPVAVLLWLTLISILHRLAFPSSELMVEYRMYPAMLFVCLLLVWGADRLFILAADAPFLSRVRSLTARPLFAWAVIILVLGLCAFLSDRGARDWRTPETLSANIAAQNPFNGRARQEAQEADLRAKRWDAALSRQEGIRQALAGAEKYNAEHPARKYDSAILQLIHVSSEGNYAEALAELGRRREATAHIDWLEGAMRTNHIEEVQFWAMFHYSRGRVYQAAGRIPEAIRDLRRADVETGSLFPFIQRALREAQASHSASDAAAGSTPP